MNRATERVGVPTLTLVTLLLLASQPAIGAGPICEANFIGVQLAGVARRDEGVDRLASLLPHLTRQQIEEKLEACPNSFLFYRSFVPLRYDLLKNSPEFTRNFGPLLGEGKTGWAFGDVHPENFGYLLNSKGKPRFTINDYDDNAKAPLALDVLSLLASVRTRDSSFPLEKLVSAYKRGLQGQEAELPGALAKIAKKAEDAGRSPPDKYYDADANRLIRSESTREASPSERDGIEKALRHSFGNEIDFRFQDALFFHRPEGGSGGLDRYVALIKVPDKTGTEKKRVVIELKALARSGLTQFEVGPPLSSSERIEAALRAAQGVKTSEFYGVESLNGKPMFVRPRFEGNLGIHLDRLQPEQVSEVLEYEAYVLGRLHSASADDRESYMRAFLSFPEQTLTQTSQELAQAVGRLYDAVRK